MNTLNNNCAYLREPLKEILESQYKGSPIWKLVGIEDREKSLAVGIPFKGELYDTQSLKIMYVGHSYNGWEATYDIGHSIDATLDSILKQNNGLDTIVYENGYPYTRKKDGKTGIYKHCHYNFFRLIKHIIDIQDYPQIIENEEPTFVAPWYHDPEKWQQKFIWSNLYLIAPRYGGNPDTALTDPFIPQYVKMFRDQIAAYAPDIVIVVPLSGAFGPWGKKKGFVEALDFGSYCERSSKIIVAEGRIDKSRVLICKRPDTRGSSHKDTWNMAKYIYKYISQEEPRI